MASKLSFPPILDFPITTQRNPSVLQSITPFSSLPSKFWFQAKPNFSCVGAIRSSVIYAVKEEVIQSSDSETTLDSNSPSASSSKVVLVVGGTGGVGDYQIFPLIDLFCLAISL